MATDEPVSLSEYTITTRGVESTIQLSDEDAQARRDAGEDLKPAGKVELTEPPDNDASNETHGDQSDMSAPTKARTAANKSRTAESK